MLIVPLGSLINNEEFSDAALIKLLSGFGCNNNQDVEDFLIEKAQLFEKTHNTRTYLIIDVSGLEGGPILAYFSLSFKEIWVGGASKTQRKQMDGFNKNAENIRAFLLGQLGKNTNVKNNPIGISDILSYVYTVLSKAQQLIGGRVIVLECQDIKRLVGLYEAQGFKALSIQSNKLRLMFKVFNVSSS